MGSYPAALTIVIVSTFLAMTAYTGPLGNAVTLSAAFDASPAGLSWVLASMSVGLAVALLPAGVLADRMGRKGVFLLGAALFIVASLGCTLADGAVAFVLARILAGAGAAGMIATGLGLVTATTQEPRHHATTATWWSVSMGGGIAAGPVLAGLLDLADGWRWLYLLLAAGGVLTAIGAWKYVPAPPADPSRSHRKLDLVGFVLLLAFLAVLITAIVELRTGPATLVLPLFGTAAVLLTALVVSQRLGTTRLVNPDLFTHRPFLAATLAGLGSGIGIIAIMAFAPTYFVTALGMTTLKAGAITTLWSGTSAVAALLLARFTARITGTTQLVIGLTGVAAGILLMLNLSPSTGPSRLILALVVAGLASGLLNGGLARQAVATVPASDVATGTAANNTARYLGAAIGVSAASMIATGTAITNGWNTVLWAGTIASLLTATIVIALSASPSRRPVTTQTDSPTHSS